MMGTSVEQIEKTYGYLLPDAHERSRRSWTRSTLAPARLTRHMALTRDETLLWLNGRLGSRVYVTVESTLANGWSPCSRRTGRCAMRSRRG
jgi:hypothetical protein